MNFINPTKQQIWRLVSLIEICLLIIWLPPFAAIGLALEYSRFETGYIQWDSILFISALTFGPPLLSILGFLGVRKYKRWGYITTVLVIPVYIATYLFFFKYFLD